MTTDELLARADMLVAMSKQILEISQDFDNSGTACECCSAFRYKNFPQKMMRDRIVGAAERLIEIAGTLRRRQQDLVTGEDQ